jgi:acyl-CoA reductase-like NAD-dependent aldehyde dehydrogenase
MAEQRTTIDIYSPDTGQFVGSVPMATPDEVDEAMTRSRLAQEGWARTAPSERAAALRAAAQAVREDARNPGDAERGQNRPPADGGL